MRVTICSVLVASLLVGCDQADFQGRNYELTEANNKVFRLNQKTGELALVQGDSIVTLAEYSPGQAKVISDTFTQGSIEFSARTKSRNGRTDYTIEITPVSPEVADLDQFNASLSEGTNVVFLSLRDRDNFELSKHRVDLSTGKTRTRNSDDTIGRLSYQGTFSSDLEIEPVIAALQVTWILNAVE